MFLKRKTSSLNSCWPPWVQWTSLMWTIAFWRSSSLTSTVTLLRTWTVCPHPSLKWHSSSSSSCLTVPTFISKFTTCENVHLRKFIVFSTFGQTLSDIIFIRNSYHCPPVVNWTLLWDVWIWCRVCLTELVGPNTLVMWAPWLGGGAPNQTWVSLAKSCCVWDCARYVL